MPRPVDGVASVTQSQNALELVQTAQRMANLAQQRQQTATEKAKEREAVQVAQQEAAHQKQIRDEDPRRDKRRQRQPQDELGHAPQDPAPGHIDIVA